MFFKRTNKDFLSKEETGQILESIRLNEQSTSGEIRLCIESHCSFMDPVLRARELFYGLKMYNTTDRNAVLIYIAHKDRDFAIFGDGAIYQQVEASFWKAETKRLAYHFFHHKYKDGITQCVNQIGIQLNKYFPWEGEKKNELPDEIIFGK